MLAQYSDRYRQELGQFPSRHGVVNVTMDYGQIAIGFEAYSEEDKAHTGENNVTDQFPKTLLVVKPVEGKEIPSSMVENLRVFVNRQLVLLRNDDANTTIETIKDRIKDLLPEGFIIVNEVDSEEHPADGEG